MSVTISAKVTKPLVATEVGGEETSGKTVGEAPHALAALKQMTKIVADSGDFKCFKEYNPVDATTNPSLILAAVEMGHYNDVVDAAIKRALERSPANKENFEKLTPIMCEELLVEFACRMLECIPGIVSVEVDPHLSFDVEGSIQRARELASLFESRGRDRRRLAFKLASTWEGFEACKVLEKEGIQCNMTLMFSITQAIAAAEAGATLVSPYVGRVLEWYQKHGPEGVGYTSETDPGVVGVKKIYNYYKKFGYKSLVMGASFRSVEEVLALAGCDNLTVAPKWLAQLKELPASSVQKQMDASNPVTFEGYEQKIIYDAPTYKWEFNNDQCAVEQLSNGLRLFNKDWKKLQSILQERCKQLSSQSKN